MARILITPLFIANLEHIDFINIVLLLLIFLLHFQSQVKFFKIMWRSSHPDVFCENMHRCFPVNFAKFLRTPFFIEHLWWLLLYVNLFKKLTKTYRNYRSRGVPILLSLLDLNFGVKSLTSILYSKSKISISKFKSQICNQISNSKLNIDLNIKSGIQS